MTDSDSDSDCEPCGRRAAPAPEKLTVAMATYDDVARTLMTVQALRLTDSHARHIAEILIVDQTPQADKRSRLAKLAESTRGARVPVRHVPIPSTGTAAARNAIQAHARTPRRVVLDCHVLLADGSLQAVQDHFDAHPDCRDLLQGVHISDRGAPMATHMRPEWGVGAKGPAELLGVWDLDRRGLDPQAPPFAIPQSGLGFFACLGDAWPGLPTEFRGYGGTEGFLHGLFQDRGDKVLCLPGVRWWHAYDDGSPRSYPLRTEDRLYNFLLGAKLRRLSPEWIEACCAHFALRHGRPWVDAIRREVFEGIPAPAAAPAAAPRRKLQPQKGRLVRRLREES